MISFRDQVILVIYFLIFGMFLSAMFDILHYFSRKFKLKLVLSYIIESIFWILMVVTACLYMLKVSDGYLSIYTFGFFFLGVVIYTYFLRDNFKNNLNLFVVFIGRIINRFKKTIVLVVYPKEAFSFIKKVVIKFKKIKNLYKKIKDKKKTGELNEEVAEINSVTSSSPNPNYSEWM